MKSTSQLCQLSPHKANKGKKVHRYYRCQNAQKRGAKSCPIGQVSSVDIEAIGVSLVRLLSIDDKLLQSILSEASSDQQSKIDTLQDQRTEIEKRIADLEIKTNKWMTTFEDSDDVDLVEVISKRVSTYSESIKEMRLTIEEINERIDKLKQPIENLDDLLASYHYFWNLWQDMKTTERQQIIKAVVKEIRLFSESPKKYRLEIELLSDVAVGTTTPGGGGGGTQVCTLFRKSTVDPNKVPTVIWRTTIIKITRRRHFPIGLELTRESLPTKRLHQRFQRFLREELPFALSRGKKPQTRQFADAGSD